jgi:hypothetical protein
MSSITLAGRWIGYYVHRDEEWPITADLIEVEERLSGFMYDGKPDHEYSIFQATSEAGLPPGTDEQFEARLREMVPDAPPGSIKYIIRLPTNSILQGRKSGQTITFLKTYQGNTVSGFQVGNQLIGTRKSGHAVHYEGRLSMDGQTMEGRWWIDANPKSGTRMTEGLFLLRRSTSDESPAAPQAQLSEKEKRPWWKFWS